MPIAAGARQSRHLDAEHETDIAEADFGNEPLKAQAALDAGPGAPEIVVCDDDFFPPPAVLRGPIGERVLQPGRFLVALNLLNRGLADVHDRQTVLVASTLLLPMIRRHAETSEPIRCPSLRAKRSNPGAAVRPSGLLPPRMLWPLDCFVARASRNDGWGRR